ncbi:hypothetical protein GOV07_01255 [Candidatus Woesearchaeota archaeon]|nr:hypothetical protein [Candidatus Woesearchaeota archaeon]
MRSRRFTLLLTFTTLIFAFLVGALTFPSAPEINSGATAYTYDDLVCAWTASGDATNVTVVWFQDGGLFSNVTYSGSLPTNNTLDASNTARDEDWICDITLFNATSSLSLEANVTIENAGPLTPTVYDGVLPIAKKNITEDVLFTLDMNSTDADNDVLTYFLLDPYFCTITNSATGAISCLATHDYVNESATNQTETPHIVSIEFWARDTPPNTKSSSKTVTFNITPVNDDPNVSISGQSIPVDQAYDQSFAATDEEEDYPLIAALNYGGTDDAIENDVTVSIVGGTNVRITYSTSPTEYTDWGNRTISFNLTDNRGANTTVAFDLEIIKVNQPPFFTNISPENYSSPLNRTYVIDQNYPLTINLSGNDPDTADRNETLFFKDNSARMSTITFNPNATNVSDAQGRITFTPGPLDVGSYSVLIFINDSNGDETNITLNFTVNNVNDAPIIYNESYNSNNTGGNIDITNMTAYLNTPFYYEINFTDYDIMFGDTLTWVHNASPASGFNVSQDGIISYTPNGTVGNETINITVTDSSGESDTVIFMLETQNNTAPYFNDTFNITPSPCVEGLPCMLNVSYYAKDNNSGNNISSYTALNLTTSIGTFSLDTGTGLINFTPVQSEIGNYTYRITITDYPGASATQDLNITIINAEDTPYWDATADFSSSTIVEDHEFNHVLRSYDEDLLLVNSTEQLTITTNITWINITGGSVSSDMYSVLLSFTPNSSTVRNHSIQLNVTDSTNLTTLLNFTFTVIADTASPVIEYIKPYGDDGNNNAPIYGWLDTSLLLQDHLLVLENQSYTFEANATDETSQANLNWTWHYDGILVRSGVGIAFDSYDYTFLFNDSGNHILTVTVQDETLNTDSFFWNLTVQDVNRQPLLAGNLQTNLSVSNVATYQDYFLLLNLGSPKGFIDPDDDVDNSGLIDGSEIQDLTYSSTSCSHATLVFSGEDLVITPLTVGECLVVFNATDTDSASAASNIVRISIDDVPQGAEVPTSSSSSGGSSSTSSTFIPIETEVESPKPLTIITPQLVTVYKNRTVIVPIRLENNWTEPLLGISLGASTNASEVELRLDTNYVEELGMNGTEELHLTVTGYRLGANFEVTVTANVTEPSFKDSALIMFNSIESAEDGEDVEVKVTFAQDLLNQNQECQELNELLIEANARLQEGNIDQAHEMVDLVINGCKYLISKTQEAQRPGVVRTPWLELQEDTIKYISFILLGVFLIIGIASLLFYHFKTKEEYDF